MTTDTLRFDRNRFLSFAFAAADMLVELDTAGKVGFAAGCCTAFTGIDADQMNGLPFLDLVDDGDRELVRQLLWQLCEKQEIGPVAVRLRGGSEHLDMRGMARMDDERMSLAFVRRSSSLCCRTMAVDPKTGLLTPDSFQLLASRLLEEERLAATGATLSLVTLMGLRSVRQGGADDPGRLLREIGGVLRSHSVNGVSAGVLSEHQFGLIHHYGVDGGIESELEAAIERCSPDLARTIEVTNIDMNAPILTQQEALRALCHTLRAFAGRVEGGTHIGSLSEALGDS